MTQRKTLVTMLKDKDFAADVVELVEVAIDEGIDLPWSNKAINHLRSKGVIKDAQPATKPGRPAVTPIGGSVIEETSAWLCGLEIVCDGEPNIHWAMTPDEWFAQHPEPQYA